MKQELSGKKKERKNMKRLEMIKIENNIREGEVYNRKIWWKKWPKKTSVLGKIQLECTKIII